MVHFIALGTNHLQNAEVFYENVLKPLNYRRIEKGRTHIGYAKQNDDLAPILYVGNPFDGQPASPGNGVMVAFSCPSQTIVNKCHELLIINGGVNEGDPGPRPHYSDSGYYAYGRDLDGNKLLFNFDAKDHT